MELSPESLEQAARALLDSRMDSVRALVAGRHQVAELRGQLAEAEREDVRLYSAALRDGWTADELKKLGLSEPEKRQRARRRNASPGAARSTSSVDAESGPPSE